MGRNSASIKDVAQASGVSIATVSNVLNRRCNVSEELSARVMKAVEELRYTANPIAQSMRSNRTRTIGVVIADYNSIFFAPLLKGIHKVLAGSEYNILTYDSNYKAENERKFIETMRNGQVDGILLAGTSNQISLEDYRERLRGSGRHVPIVCIETDMTRYGIDSVFIDNAKAAHTAASHLIELGCRRIVHIQGAGNTASRHLRLDGYLKAHRDAGIPADPKLYGYLGNYAANSGYNTVRDLIRSDVDFDGVFAANDQMAVGAIRALRNEGIRIPEEVKIVGFDNTFIASIVEPSLTTVSVPTYNMGMTAATQLLYRIENPEAKAATIQVDYELIIRRSTIASARTNWDMQYW